MRWWVIAVVACELALAAPSRAEPAQGSNATVALLPLDAEPALEIYGQPVASEVARALVAGGVDVVVVGPRMAVPERAVLIVDGTITPTGTPKTKDAVQLAVRIRDRASGTVVDGVQASADSLATIDRAAADLSSRVVPAVKAQLAAIERAKAQQTATEKSPPPPVKQAAPPLDPIAPSARTGIALVGIAPAKSAQLAPLHDALSASLDAWVKRAHHTLTAIDSSKIHPELVASSRADVGVVLDVLDYQTEDLDAGSAAQPSARARVRLWVVSAHKIIFDRVISTDTVIGARDQLVALVARDILWIAEPRLREVTAWK